MTTLVRFLERLRNFPMNAEFERLISTVFESSARSAQAGHPRLTSGRPKTIWCTRSTSRRAGGQDRRGDRRQRPHGQRLA